MGVCTLISPMKSIELRTCTPDKILGGARLIPLLSYKKLGRRPLSKVPLVILGQALVSSGQALILSRQGLI